MEAFDIAPFGLPNCPSGEVWFEEPRQISRVVVGFRGPRPRRVSLLYWQSTWPKVRLEALGGADVAAPCRFGWTKVDDWFNGHWQRAAVEAVPTGRKSLALTFKGLGEESEEITDYNVTFRRTLAVRLEPGEQARIRNVRVYTESPAARSRVRVELDAGRRTPGRRLELSGYNASVRNVEGGPGVTADGCSVGLGSARRRGFAFDVSHMRSSHRYANDDGLVTFSLDGKAFTISLTALEQDGPVWFAERGVFVALADDATSFDDYRSRIEDSKRVSQRVREHTEQSLSGAFRGQPRPHAVAFSVGCKHARQRFWVQANGDVVLNKHNVTWVPGEDTPRFKNDGDGRFFFGLEDWQVLGRSPDPAPLPIYRLRFQRGDVSVEQESLAVPLARSILDGEPTGDETVVGLFRFRFRNVGEGAATAELRVAYSQDSGRGDNRGLDPAEEIRGRGGRITAAWHGARTLRCTYESDMRIAAQPPGVVLGRRLEPGQSCEALLKIPYVALETKPERDALAALNFERCRREVEEFWRKELARGAQVHTPEPRLNALHASHLAHVMMADMSMPGEPELLNTSVGMSTYGNFCNESCMIIHELDQRGLHEAARRRLDVWVRYQGTAALKGNFTDHDGLFYGAGGFESGATYVQHHGWVLWCLAEHFLLTGDGDWFAGIADSVVAGVDWVARQRAQTTSSLPHSRGWEKGLLPAGSLEDAADFGYWFVSDAMTWRGVKHAAKALETIGHPEAARAQREADAYRRDLLCAVETASRHAPLVRLGDGRWVPHYPSRLYRRGRQVGWIREVLGGTIYLLLSGLYDVHGPEAAWILDDHQDNRYMSPPYGYPVTDLRSQWFSHGGFSIQPNLVAGLMPYLERDEPELYIWTFFNSWCACYRQEINAMVEHPMPLLGFSNAAHPKTSDEANAVAWLRYMFVYVAGETLHLGRAIPRAWLRDGEEPFAEKVATRYGKVDVRYSSEAADRRINVTANLKLREDPRAILVRIRHPDQAPIKSVRVNGKKHTNFDAAKGDVDITGRSGKVTIEARY